MNEIDDRRFLVCVVLLMLIVTSSVSRYFGLFKISGNSMYPTLKDGDYYLTDKADVININDVVIAETQERYFFGLAKKKIVKRVAGCPGDTLQIRDGILYINEKSEEEFLIENKMRTNSRAKIAGIKIENAGILNEPYTLKDDEYFLMGDNRNGSDDSRVIGAVSKETIKRKINL